ncbi:hypothetical protein T492DRAFT_844157 [Pavlovales sp. CCMP2436]|nr:hypothetical protein T492DRAFT_844157 [Pavlovales sp. CCMP2436]
MSDSSESEPQAKRSRLASPDPAGLEGLKLEDVASPSPPPRWDDEAVALSTNELIESCPKAGCGYLFCPYSSAGAERGLRVLSQPRYDCRRCGQSYCLFCLQVWHDDGACIDVNEPTSRKRPAALLAAPLPVWLVTVGCRAATLGDGGGGSANADGGLELAPKEVQPAPRERPATLPAAPLQHLEQAPWLVAAGCREDAIGGGGGNAGGNAEVSLLPVSPCQQNTVIDSRFPTRAASPSNANTSQPPQQQPGWPCDASSPLGRNLGGKDDRHLRSRHRGNPVDFLLPALWICHEPKLNS